MIFTIIRYHYVFIKPFWYYQKKSLYLNGDDNEIFNNIWDTDKMAIVVILCKCVCVWVCVYVLPSQRPSTAEGDAWDIVKGTVQRCFFFNASANFSILSLGICHASPSKTNFQLRITPERNDMIFDATAAKIVKMIYIWYSI